MLFNSFTFLAFMAVVLPLYYSLRMRGQNLLLLVAGFVFYGWWDWRFLLLLTFSAVIDYAMALRIVDHVVGDPRRKRWLIISMVVNLTILGFFKYFNFFIDSAATLLDTFGFEAHLPTLRIVLPVGVSFYTFQSMSYTIDAYRGTIQPTRSLLHYLSFVAYFPQLVAGPIERAANMLPVFVNERKVDARCISEGLLLILLGFFKKLVIADAVAGSVSAAFAEPLQLDGAQLLRAVYLFSLQIYADFSGYSDIARGVSKLFGIDLMINFNQPYLSSSITEFWRRWHISLSSWLRDYLYIPLGGSRNGTVATYRNNFLTMLIGGLWHGASWNFVIWGGLHGLYLAAHKYWMGLRGIKEPPPHLSAPVACLPLQGAGDLPPCGLRLDLLPRPGLRHRQHRHPPHLHHLERSATHPLPAPHAVWSPPAGRRYPPVSQRLSHHLRAMARTRPYPLLRLAPCPHLPSRWFRQCNLHLLPVLSRLCSATPARSACGAGWLRG